MSPLGEIPLEHGPRAPTERDAKTVDPETLGKTLRFAGALLVLASASTFMLQQWTGKDDLFRYGMLVAHGLMLAGAAYFCGLGVRESRSARTLLALVLGIVPITFAVLGGLVYSRFHLEPLSEVPRYASWVAPSGLAAVLAVAATLVVLAPLALVAFVALSRKRARSLCLAFLVSNLFLLVPVRAPDAILVMLAVLVVALSRLEVSYFAPVAQLQTTEGRIARAMPFVAPALMAGRVVHLYHPTSAFAGGAALLAGYAVWCWSPKLEAPRLRELSAWASGAFFVLGIWLAAPAFGLAFGPLGVIAVGLPSAASLLAATHRARRTRAALLALATAVALLTVLAALAMDRTTLTAFAALLVGTLVALSGAGLKSRLRLVAGGAVGLFGLVCQVVLATRANDVLRWAGLSVVGVLLIVGSSFVERHKDLLASRFAATERE